MTEAERLADLFELEQDPESLYRVAAAELRRLQGEVDHSELKFTQCLAALDAEQDKRLALQGEIEALRKDKLAADALRANLAASWFYGRWVAETPNEQEQQALMEQAGWWPWADEDALVAAVDAALAARLGDCNHAWASADNPHVSNAVVCLNCGDVRAKPGGQG